MNQKISCAAVLAGLALIIGGCASTPEVSVPEAGRTPEQMYALVRAAAGQDERELNVQPLRDPQVEDLRASGMAALSQRQLDVASVDLQKALEIMPDDPAVLQENAEVALLQGNLPQAETLASKAVDLGSAVGPLCRRHWETIRQVRQKQLDLASVVPPREKDTAAAERNARVAVLKAGVTDASRQFDACTVAGLNRY